MQKRILGRQLLAGVGFVALMAASPANAAGYAPPPAPVGMWSWSGIYVGGHAGYGWGRDPFSDPVFESKSPAAPALTDISSNGGVAGFQGGVNWQSGSWVGGMEIDFSFSSMRGSSSTTTGNIATPPALDISTASQTDKFDSLGSARARLGYLPWPNVLLYGTAGPAWTRLVQSFEATRTTSDPAGSTTTTLSETNPTWRFGAVAGVGAETRLGDSNWLARLEYLHYDFGKSDSSFETGFLPLTSGRLTADVVRGGLSYKLGQDSAISAIAPAIMPVKAPRIAPAIWTWSGFYIGGHAGYGWGHDPFTDHSFSTIVSMTGIDSNGFVGGFQAGGNWQMGAFVGGIEVDLSATGIKGSSSIVAVDNDFVATRTDNFDLLGSARARLGYLVWPQTLLYGTGGLAWTRLAQTADEVSIGTNFASSETDVFWEFGWVAGLGVETRLGNTNWLARVEYLHYDFGDSGTELEGSSVNFTSGHLTTDVVRGGLSYKFDWNGGTAPAPPGAMPVKARPRVAAWSWDGFYLGGHVGYGWGRDPSTDFFVPTGTAISLTDPGYNLDTGIDSRGFVAGFQAGANRQWGTWLTGLEIDQSGTGIKGSKSFTFPDGITETNTDKFATLGSARGRLGYLVLPNALLYGTGGLAWTRVDQSSFRGTTPSWEFGWVAGVGGEARLWESNWLLRIEYLHYDFGNASTTSIFSASSNAQGQGSDTEADTSGHLTTDLVRTGLSYKFN